MKNFVVLSTKRSSHHAFIESFLKDEEYLYDNNLVLRKGEMVPSVTLDSGSLPSIHVSSFERNYDPEELLESYPFKEKIGVESKDFSLIVFLRDPLNTIASTYSVYLKRSAKNPDFPIKYLKDNVAQYEKVMKFIECRGGVSDEFFVYANSFWKDSAYRSRLSDIFGLSFTVFNDVSTFAGGGSTFFGNKKVDSSDLDSRFVNYSNDNFFREFLASQSGLIHRFFSMQKDEELLDIYRRYFDK